MLLLGKYYQTYNLATTRTNLNLRITLNIFFLNRSIVNAFAREQIDSNEWTFEATVEHHRGFNIHIVSSIYLGKPDAANLIWGARQRLSVEFQ